MSWDWLERLQVLRAKGDPYVMVTVARCSGSSPRETGAKMFVTLDQRISGTIGGGGLERQAISDALQCLEDGRSKALLYPLHASVGQCCGGTVELLYEVIQMEPKLYLFGAGHVAQALCQVLKGTPFQVHLIDERKEWVHADGLPPSVRAYDAGWRSFIEHAFFDEKKTMVAIMTHDHEQDFKILKALLDKSARSIGLIGSESKWKAFRNRFEKEGIASELFSRVKCPIGLNTGGKAPQEVAISIAAELLQIHYDR